MTLAADYDFDLPPALIAQSPLPERDASRMLVLDCRADRITHARVRDLPDYLRSGDVLVRNDTRVFPARIFGRWKDTGGRVELLMIEALTDGQWHALCRSGRALHPGLAVVLDRSETTAVLTEGRDALGRVTVCFDAEVDVMALLDRLGRPPLPPYIRRDRIAGDSSRDRERYQTVYARRIGSVAAPTAGLHFTESLLDRLRRNDVVEATVTLHVGPGTFRPVKTEHLEAHPMDLERYSVPRETAMSLRDCRARGGRIAAVGSTSVRTLETMAIEHAGPAACSGQSRLYIYPPFKFQMTDVLLTNFHLPRSTLLMMVAALAGRERVLRAYAEAIRHKYRFYSYGDCMLIVT